MALWPGMMAGNLGLEDELPVLAPGPHGLSSSSSMNRYWGRLSVVVRSKEVAGLLSTRAATQGIWVWGVAVQEGSEGVDWFTSGV